MGTNPVAFQLHTSDGPVIYDEDGNPWRYLHYPEGTPAANHAGVSSHDGWGLLLVLGR